MGERGHVWPCLAANGNRTEIAGQPPPCVEGCPKAGDRKATQKRFKAECGGDRPDLVHLRQQPARVGVRQDQIGGACVDKRAEAQARFDIRMGFVEDNRIGVFRTNLGN
jgi:hypothetical protein